MKKIFWFINKFKQYLLRNNNNCDYERTCGYFNVDKEITIRMESGRLGVYRRFSLKYYRDPWDMVKSVKYTFIGYKDMKPMADCTFGEFITIYRSL